MITGRSLAIHLLFCWCGIIEPCFAQGASAAQADPKTVISAKDFGARGDGVADDTQAIQAAVDAVILRKAGHTVFLPAGKYRTSDTIHLGYGNKALSAVVLQGEGYMYAPTVGTMNGTAILPNFSDRPCINVQGGRGTVIRGLSLGGRLRKHIESNSLGSVTSKPTKDDTHAEFWDDPDLAATADSRYSPYAGIAVDAYSGPAPAIRYPAVKHPESLGEVPQYGKAFSSDVLVEDCYIEGFSVAVANQPCDADANADFTSLRRVSIAYCKWGVSVGNTQSRNVHLDAVKFTHVYCCLTNSSHGRQQGKFGGAIIDMSVASCVQLVNLRQYQSTVTFQNLYAEALWKIGTINAVTTAEVPLLFSQSSINFQAQNETRGVPPNVLDGAGQAIQVRFSGCAFSNYPSVLSFYERGVSFDNCSFAPTGTRPEEYERFAHNATAGGLATFQLANGLRANLKFTPFDHATGEGARSGASIFGPLQKEAKRSRCISLYAERVAASDDLAAPSIEMPSLVTVVAKDSLAALAIEGKTLTFSFKERAEATFRQDGPLPGDVIWDDSTGSVFFVRARKETLIVAELQNNFRGDAAAGYTQVIPIPLRNGHFYIGNSRVYTPPYYLRADSQTGNPILSNVARDDGFADWLEGEVAAGDALRVRETSDRWVAPANAVITARDGVAGTITLNGECARSETRKRLDLFTRAAPKSL